MLISSKNRSYILATETGFQEVSRWFWCDTLRLKHPIPDSEIKSERNPAIDDTRKSSREISSLSRKVSTKMSTIFPTLFFRICVAMIWVFQAPVDISELIVTRAGPLPKS